MALSGINYSKRRGAARIRQIGLAGIQVEIPGALGVKVEDMRGRAIPNATVTFANPDTSSPYTAATDSQGNALVQQDGSDPNPVTVTKDRVITEKDYVDEAVSFTVVMDMMKNKPQIL
jgi:hypothetical protein